jgi:hypothetical protein
MFHGQLNNGVGQKLLSAVQENLHYITTAQLLRFEIPSIPVDQELSIMMTISTFLMEIWERRLKKQRIRRKLSTSERN